MRISDWSSDVCSSELKRLAPLGIKVLSLFFIDAVDHYRSYDEDGNAVKGKYATMFEEEYRRAAKLPEFSSLFKEVDLTSEAEDVHDGYFSIDQNKRWTDTADKNKATRNSATRAYNIIQIETAECWERGGQTGKI